jgi:ATP-dependent RNA helicase RhlE
MDTLSFGELALNERLLRTLEHEGLHTPTPVQAQGIPLILAGRDVLASAQTGSGKTAAFALPIIQQLAVSGVRPTRNNPQVLVLAPTRELAAQIALVFDTFGSGLRLFTTVLCGGVGKGPQVNALNRGVHIVVATPGRLLDLLQERALSLDHAETVVLDEADRMLDMGFIPDVERIIRRLPSRRQSLFFSATLPPDVVRLASTMLTDPARIAVEQEATQKPDIAQQVLFVARNKKRDALRTILSERSSFRALVFTRTKYRARDLARYLQKNGIASDDLHGDKSQNARTRALQRFHAGTIQVLVATDIASRGIDVDDIDHVVNFELPSESDSYVHRIGRTARAGRSGSALSFCDETELDKLSAIQKGLGRAIPVLSDHAYHTVELAEAARRRGSTRSRSTAPQRGPRRPSRRRSSRRGRAG